MNNQSYSRAAITAAVCWCLAQCLTYAENRSIDGSGNNITNQTWGAAGTQLARKASAAYDNGFSTPRGGLLVPTSPNPILPNARVVSNAVVAQTLMSPNNHHMTDWVFQWGQFVDHDLDLTNLATPIENFNVAIPVNDAHFDPNIDMELQRSKFDPLTGTGPGNPRQQINDVTSYLDASMVYGSDTTRANLLREHAGGRLLTSSDGMLMPLNIFGQPNGTGGQPATQFYLAGDVRANEQVGLTAVHTLFVREHNRLANQVALTVGGSDEEIYQRARKIVGAEIQAITYNEFLPALLGSSAPSVSSTYDPNLNGSVLTEFSTALYRVGHTMLSPHLMRIQNDGTAAPGGAMSLKDSFFKMQNLSGANEVEYFLKGLAAQPQQEVDMHIVDDVRDFLFGEPLPGRGFDLAALNIQRGRDHGLPGYNAVRQAFGLAPKGTYADISSEPTIQAGLQSLYSSVDDIDPWVGALSEDHYADSQVGELITIGLAEQFRRTRDGDRLWFLRDTDLSADDVSWLLSMRLSDIIRMNTSITNLQSDVFFMQVPEPVSGVLLSIAVISMSLFCRRLR